MLNNFLCDTCVHYVVCEKMKYLMKFHDSAKKDLLIEPTMDDCQDYKAELANEKLDGESLDASI